MSGVVTFAGWTGGGGRTVRVRHASGYESEYLHLSSIATGSGLAGASGRASWSAASVRLGSRPGRIFTTACAATARM